ncbi:MAG: ABC transporter permease [Deltaproteobacteria bacterium]|nr:ABC transporter permease [Deltaproteobacteria bacterium]
MPNPPAMPSTATVLRQIAALSLRRARRGRLVRVILVALALPLVASAFGLISGRGGLDFFEMLLTNYLRYLIPVVMSLQATATLAEEVQGRTLGYLFSRPIPRFSVPLGKYLANVTLSGTLLLASITLCYLISAGSEIFAGLDLLLGALGGVLLAACYFGAVAAAFGSLVTNHALTAMLIYVLAIDIGVGLIPGVKVVSAGIHLLAVVGLYRPHTNSFFAKDPQLSPGISLAVIAGMTVLWLILAISWVKSTEYRTDR